MMTLTLKDLNILDIGNSITISGLIMSNGTEDFLCYLPEEKRSGNVTELEMNTEDWDTFFKQTDLLETEVLAKAADGKLTKIIIRKSQRQIEAGVSWRVFHRDGYACRYCNIMAVPMTVDHVICWEVGGPSIEENLVTSCRKCNKLRGNMSYGDWLNSKEYQERSRGLSEKDLQKNLDVLEILNKIPIKHHIQKR
jgi:hypothetical protein